VVVRVGACVFACMGVGACVSACVDVGVAVAVAVGTYGCTRLL
jgi:hypothetical protein